MSLLSNLYPRLLVPLALALAGGALCAALLPVEMAAVTRQLVGFPDSDVPAHLARPRVLAGLCFLPCLAAAAYALGGTLDRYVAREFLANFFLCLAALFAIWLLIDLADKLGDFRDGRQVLRTMARFYVVRSPAVLLLLLPYSLLLALLYSLGKFSGNRELVAMIQSGRGLVRITLPLIVAGAFFTLLSAGLNYQWAPAAEGAAEEIIPAAQGKVPVVAKRVLYRNPEGGRLWEIGAFPRDYERGESLLDVEVTTTGPGLALRTRLSAASATWDLARHTWTFERPLLATFSTGRPPVFEPLAAPLVVADWPETPWQLVKPGLAAANLGVPDLGGWLRENARRGEFADPAPYLTQWHHRWALPLTCMVTVLLAIPLSIHFSRRGAGGGVFMAVVLCALLLLVTSIAIALGESGTLRPAVAAWLPNGLFALLALYLFRRRATGKPIYLVLRKLFPAND